MPIRWEIPSGTVRLNEFDPYYQFSITNHMVQYGLLSPYWPTPWINTQQWYPAGLNMAGSLPALPMTAATLYTIVSFFGVNIDLMTFCSILPAVLGTLAVLIVYLIGKDMGGRAVGLFAALFFGLAPSFLQRSALGFFDTEVPGVLALVLFIFLFLRAIEETRSLRSSLFYSLGAGATLAYFILGWGAAYFLLDLTALFVFILILLKRYSPRLLLAYSVSFGFGLFLATKFPYISLDYLTSGAVVPVAGVFVLLILAEILRNNISNKTKVTLTVASFAVIIGGFLSMWLFGGIENIAGKFVSVLDPFARAASPLIESVAEHRISSWGNLYFDLGISILFFIAGLYFTLRNPTNRNVFLLIFGTTSLYFASSMVRLLVIFAPAFSLLVAIGILGILKPFYTLLREAPQLAVKSKRKLERVSKEYSGIAVFLVFIILVTNLAFAPQSGGVPRVYGTAYSPLTISASSLPVGGQGLTSPVPEWLDMLSWTQNNLQSTTVVCAWWDYGNWLGYLGNVTNLADNTTVNGTQIENIGFVFMSNETEAVKMLSNYDASYILVFTVLAIGQTSSGTYVASPANLGDEGKWIWMAKISGQAHDRLIDEHYIPAADMWTDETPFGAVNNQTNQFEWSDKGLNCTIYKLMSNAWEQWEEQSGQFSSVALTNTVVAPTLFKLTYITGADIPYYQYGGLIPLVALYEVDYQAYYNATGTG
jgi:dolichyl-diphosphooligosaccharide--protein glycosyltransferase